MDREKKDDFRVHTVMVLWPICEDDLVSIQNYTYNLSVLIFYFVLVLHMPNNLYFKIHSEQSCEDKTSKMNTCYWASLCYPTDYSGKMVNYWMVYHYFHLFSYMIISCILCLMVSTYYVVSTQLYSNSNIINLTVYKKHELGYRWFFIC